jgi:ABC-type polysaccharide/polyol phosphate export permease
MFLPFFKGLWEFRLVFGHLVRQYVSLRYRRTALGFLWTLVNPLLTMAVTAVVFSLMMRFPLKGFAVFLFSGLIPWTLFSNCLLQGGQSLLENEALIKKIYVPRQTLVVARCTSLLIDAVLSFTSLFVIALVLGAHFGPALAVLPLAFVLTFLFSCGIALITSVTSVFLRDTQQIMGIVMQAGYYLTPIIYPISIVPERYRWIFQLNPMYHFVELFRYPIYEGQMPPMQTLWITAGCAAISVLLGLMVFRRYDNEVIFRL